MILRQMTTRKLCVFTLFAFILCIPANTGYVTLEDSERDAEIPECDDVVTVETNRGEKDILRNAKKAAQDWLISVRDGMGGWHDQTHRVIIALSLSDSQILWNGQMQDVDLTLRQLDLQLALALAKKHTEHFSVGQLALYVNALRCVCRNPHNFYGINLVSKLYHGRDNVSSEYEFALVALTLCNTGVRLQKSHLLQLVEMLPERTRNRTDHQNDDSKLMALLALQCATRDAHLSYLKRYVSRSLRKLQRLLKTKPMGNIYTSSLLIHVLLEAGDDVEWNKEEAMAHLIKHQMPDGSFSGNLLATFLALPPISGRTLASISHISCNTSTDSIHNETQNDTEAVQFSQGQNTIPTVAVTLSFWTPQSNLSKVIFAEKNSSLYTVISTGLTGYRVSIHTYFWGHYISGINEWQENLEGNLHWRIYEYHSANQTTIQLDKGIDEVYIQDKDHYVFVYKKF